MDSNYKVYGLLALRMVNGTVSLLPVSMPVYAVDKSHAIEKVETFYKTIYNLDTLVWKQKVNVKAI